MDPIWQQVITFLCFGIAMVMIRHWIVTLGKKIDDCVSSGSCEERRNDICRKITKVEEEATEQWGIINHHGHKGLDGDNNQVVRTA